MILFSCLIGFEIKSKKILISFEINSLRSTYNWKLKSKTILLNNIFLDIWWVSDWIGFSFLFYLSLIFSAKGFWFLFEELINELKGYINSINFSNERLFFFCFFRFTKLFAINLKLKTNESNQREFHSPSYSSFDFVFYFSSKKLWIEFNT